MRSAHNPISSTFLHWLCLRVAPAVVLLSAQAPGAAQTVDSPHTPATRPAVIAAVIEERPRIDGILDDACWQAAAPLTGFTQVLPIEGAPPTERTEVRFAFTDDSLYIAIRCYDTAPQEIIARQMQRDSDFDPDDLVMVAFDTFNRQRDGYFFMVNPTGARADGLIENFCERRFEWDAIWDAAARIDGSGWTIEMAIPFKSLSFDPRQRAWGCNIERVIRRKQEVVRWTSLSRARSATTLSDFGELRGLTGLQQGIGLELRPFVSLKFHHDPAADRSEWEFRPGGDVTYRITPSLTANATFNTDFAEAEVDSRVINLTRFPVSFPEKRDFFLQDSSLFRFGGYLTPYYSRRIGLSANGMPVDILAGGRLTGRIGNTQVALLDVQQDGYDGVPSKNLFVGRVSTRVLDESNIGLIATHGDPRVDGDNALLGADFNYLNSRLPQGRQLVGHAWAVGTDSDRAGGRDAAFGAVLDYPNEPFSMNVLARQVGENFDPALGFVSRRGERNYSTFARYLWRPNAPVLRSISTWTRWEYFTDLDNRIVTENNDVLTIEFETPAGDELELQYGFDRDVLDDPFEIRPGILIPAGDYWDGHVMAAIETSEARPVRGWINGRAGGFYTGDRQDYEAGLDWRPSRHLMLGAAYEFNRVRLAEGAFDVHMVTCRMNIAFTPNLIWQNLVQYDNLSDDLGLNSRVRWTWKPGNDIFFVVNQGWRFDDWRFERLQSEVAVKVGATFRF